MNILVLTELRDTHAAAVAWGLRKHGYHADVWIWSEFLRGDSCSLHLEPDGCVRNSMVMGDNCTLTPPYDVIWNRRRSPVHPRESTTEIDGAFVRKEASRYLSNVLAYLGDEHTYWVNDPRAAREADNKMAQLVAARRIGFVVPETLMTNDAKLVRGFFHKHEGKIIYKSFNPAVWWAKDGSYTQISTTALTLDRLEDTEAIVGAPGIYQPLIDKDYEIRATVLGDVVLAAAIFSQASGESIDWRHDFIGKKLPLRAIYLPEHIAGACRSLCNYLGIVFGAIDIIVTKGGEYVFLEVNEGGQFLWEEEIDPSIPLLDTFCRLLTHAEKGDCRAERLSFSDFLLSHEFEVFKAITERIEPTKHKQGVFIYFE